MKQAWWKNGRWRPAMIWHFDDWARAIPPRSYKQRVYITGMINGMGNIFAFDHSGNLKWKKEYGPEWTENHFGYVQRAGNKWQASISWPLSDTSSAWTPLMDRYLDINTFQRIRGRNISWGVTEIFFTTEYPVLFTGGPWCNVIALNRNTGKLIWKARETVRKSAYCSPYSLSYGTENCLWQWWRILSRVMMPQPPVPVEI